MGQLARWLTLMEEYDFDVQHRAGSKHGNADGLSRRPATADSGEAALVRVAVVSSDAVVDATVVAEQHEAAREHLRYVRVSAGESSISAGENVIAKGHGPSEATVRTDVSMDVISSDSDVVMADVAIDDASVSTGETFPVAAEDALLAEQQDDIELGPLVRMRLSRTAAPDPAEVSIESTAVKTLIGLWETLEVPNGVVHRRRWSPKNIRRELLQLLVPVAQRVISLLRLIAV